MRRNCIIFLCTMILVLSHTSKTVIVGSDSTPSRQALISFPAADSNNEMRGFAAFDAGFTLATSATACLFNSLLPVGGTITLNNGTLNLAKKLFLTSKTIFSGGGTINGNGLSFDLPYKNSPLSISSAVIFNNITLNINSDITLTALLTFNGTCFINGNGNTVICSSGGKLAVGTGATVMLNNIVLKSISAGKVYCVNSAGTLGLSDVKWIQDGAYSFTQGRMSINNKVLMTGAQIFTYQSNQTTPINSQALWQFDAGMTFSYAPTSSSNSLISLQDSTSKIHLYETDLYTTTTALQFTKGQVIIEGTCPVVSRATVAAQGIWFGDGSSSGNNVDLKILNDSGLQVNNGFVVNANV